MRALFAAVGLLMLAACGQTSAPTPQPPTEGFTLQVFAKGEDDEVYLVTHTDGRAVAGRVRAGASELMPAAEAEALVQGRMGVLGQPERFAFRLPGISLSVAGNPDETAEDRSRVVVNVGGRQVLVDAEGNGPGGQAAVVISGASEDDVREFIDGVDKLSAATKAEMLQALQLEPAAAAPAPT